MQYVSCLVNSNIRENVPTLVLLASWKAKDRPLKLPVKNIVDQNKVYLMCSYVYTLMCYIHYTLYI